jgi:hypothetical protein
MTALILVILVSSGEASSPASQSMLHATADALGLQADVSVHEIDANAGDDDVIAAGKNWHADAVVRVSWQDGHRHATVHLHGESSARWIDREIGFQASDAEEERGRTIGFAVISMLPEGVVPHAAPPPPPPPETPKKQADRDAQQMVPPPEDDPEAGGDDDEPARTWHGAIDVLGIGAVGLGGEAAGIGGALRGQWFFLPDFSIRVGGGARAGSISDLAAQSLTIFGSGGISWHPTTPSARHPFGLGGSLDVSALHQQLTLTNAAGVDESQGRWLPAADLTMEGSFYFTDNIAIVAAIGAEMVFGKTDVLVGGQNVATLPPLRGIGEAGARIRF